MDKTMDTMFRASRISALGKTVPYATAFLTALALGQIFPFARHFLVAVVSGGDFPSFFAPGDHGYGVTAMEVRFVVFTLSAVVGLLFMAAVRLACQRNEKLARPGFTLCAILAVLCVVGLLVFPYRADLLLFIYFSAEGALVSALALAYMATVSLICERYRRLGRWAFSVPATFMGLSLLALLLSPAYRLILYVSAMGVTPMRLFGLLYVLGAAVVILWFLRWALQQEADDGRAEHAVAGYASQARQP